jgi:hypothetical protein
VVGPSAPASLTTSAAFSYCSPPLWCAPGMAVEAGLPIGARYVCGAEGRVYDMFFVASIPMTARILVTVPRMITNFHGPSEPLPFSLLPTTSDAWGEPEVLDCVSLPAGDQSAVEEGSSGGVDGSGLEAGSAARTSDTKSERPANPCLVSSLVMTIDLPEGYSTGRCLVSRVGG